VLVACKNSQTPPFEAGQKRSVVSASRRPVGRPLRWGLLLRVCAPRSFACGRRAAQPRRGIGAGALSGLRTFFSSRGRLGACSAEAAIRLGRFPSTSAAKRRRAHQRPRNRERTVTPVHFKFLRVSLLGQIPTKHTCSALAQRPVERHPPRRLGAPGANLGRLAREG
jgi:hypothetical protein